MFFTDEQHGWVIGEMVMKTMNGGVNWYSCPVCLDAVNDLFFIDPQIGYLAGKKGNKATILKTVDAGQSWTSILSDSTLFTAMCIQFIDENIGYAGGYQKVFKTLDGGETWFDAGAPLLGYIVTSLHFADKNTGCAVNERGKIAMTSDGGESWSVCSYTGMDISSVQCLGENNAWICGKDTLGFYGMVKHTSDGGASWISVIDENSNCINSIDFLDETGWFVGTHGTVYLTHDEGGIWSKISGSFTKASLLSVFFINQYVGWVSGYYPNKIYKTEDGGFHWSEIFDFGNIYLWDFLFTDAQNGWGIYGPSIYKSNNGGLSWDSVFSVSGYSVNSIQAVDQNTLFITDYSSIYRSLDGGINWETITIDDSATSYSNIFFMGDHGWIRASYGNWLTYESSLYYSHDGGMTWGLIGESDQYNKLYFINEDTGFATAYHTSWGGWSTSHIDKTIDGGYTWEVKYITGGEYWCPSFHTIAFANETKGWAMGYGYTLVTNDGGETWEAEPQTQSGGEDIFFYDVDMGWYVDEYKIWKYGGGSIVGMNEIEQSSSRNKQMKVYPNPTNGYINVELAAGEKVAPVISILNIRGELIENINTGAPGKTNLRLDLSRLPNGIYLLRMQALDWNKTAKVVIAK